LELAEKKIRTALHRACIELCDGSALVGLLARFLYRADTLGRFYREPNGERGVAAI
jgi:hypothetical protein